MDFLRIVLEETKKGIEISPDFHVRRSKDLMVRGHGFYAIWDEAASIWSTDEYEVGRLIDNELDKYKEKLLAEGKENIRIKYMRNFSSGSWTRFQRYVEGISDNSHQLDEKLTFLSTKTVKSDYVSKRLPYDIEEGDISAWEELVSTLYNPEERDKIEWAIGDILSGDSRTTQKFLVFYGAGGTGKSTMLGIVQQLFNGYCATFDAAALGAANNLFATETLKDNPLVAVQTDGDMSKIEDNTKINTIVAHEDVIINPKHHSAYPIRLNTFLMLASNKPVKITDAKSGLIRRLIDVHPTGNKIPRKRFDALKAQIGFELGAIAKHCLDRYRALGKNYYDAYVPIDMMFKTDAFFNFVEDQYPIFAAEDGTSLKAAYAAYKIYFDESGEDAKKRLPQYKFREELKDYFKKFDAVARVDGKQIRSYYSGFLKEKFSPTAMKPVDDKPLRLVLDKDESLLDILLKDCPAQYANDQEAPTYKWENVRTTLKDIDTRKLHYVNIPEEMRMVGIDFDIRNDKGEKDMALNLEAASKWPPTYAEFSKGGAGIHLHYIWNGCDPKELSSVVSPGIEVKVFCGNSSLRRRLSKCNDIPVATLSSGLPRKEKKVVNFTAIEDESHLRAFVKSCLQKKHHGATKPEIDFIFSKLEEVYNSGMHYDITDMRQAVLSFAMGSTHQAENCVKIVSKMHFRSEDASPSEERYSDDTLVFYDVEVFPNLLLVNWKYEDRDECYHMINPTSEAIENLMTKKLVGFNNRRYDNHILYARFMHWSNEEIYALSQRIISGSKNCMFQEAYNLSYADIYDFASKKQSLKKWEIEMGFHHQELGLPWDQPVPEEKWEAVSDYCDNDVKATEMLWKQKSIQADWTARKILAKLSGLSVNDTTNQHTTRIIFRGDKEPQRQFNYRFLGTEDYETYSVLGAVGNEVEELSYPNFTLFGPGGKPVFPGYSFDKGHSTYRDEEVGEGGYVYAEPGMYRNVALLDIASMHPSSIVAEELFGPVYTQRFKDILEARIAIKHGDFEKARTMLDGKLAPFLEDESKAGELASALKIAVNSVYGLTSAKFDNPFRDIRNKDNIVAKRGALFMVNLKHEVQKRGFTVAHIKTDSIKIPNATPEIIQFVMDYGKVYGYSFEHESTYDRMCLVNDAVYIAHVESGKHAGEWVAVGAQFQQPYVFKTLFSHEKIEFKDICETKSVTTSIYLDYNENLADGEHNYVFVGRVGSFCPILPGKGGGVLLREKILEDGLKAYYAVTGSKGYRWREAETIDTLGFHDIVDISYFNALVDQAREDISNYGDFDWFVDLDSKVSDSDILQHSKCSISCFECPKFHPMDSVEESEIYLGTCDNGYL